MDLQPCSIAEGVASEANPVRFSVFGELYTEIRKIPRHVSNLTFCPVCEDAFCSTGIVNVVNNCYISAIMQCLSNHP